MMYRCLLPFECYFSSGTLIPGWAWRFSLLFFFWTFWVSDAKWSYFVWFKPGFYLYPRSRNSRQKIEKRRSKRENTTFTIVLLPCSPSPCSDYGEWHAVCCNSLSCTVYACLLRCVIFEREKEARGKERLRKHTDLIFLCICNSYVCGWRKSRPFFSPHLWMGGRMSPYCMYIYAGTWKNRIANKIQKGTLEKKKKMNESRLKKDKDIFPEPFVFGFSLTLQNVALAMRTGQVHEPSSRMERCQWCTDAGLGYWNNNCLRERWGDRSGGAHVDRQNSSSSSLFDDHHHRCFQWAFRCAS